MPKRIQMTRHRPWRADNPDAVRVDRRTKWGNPLTLDMMRERYPDHELGALRHLVVNAFRRLVEGRFEERSEAASYPSHDEIVAELHGRDLACWCPLDQPCHADVLLELANPA